MLFVKYVKYLVKNEFGDLPVLWDYVCDLSKQSRQ